MADSPIRPLALGFLTVRPIGADRWRGGYLLTNGFGRPIEFHFSTPIELSPAVRVLYGASLEPYVHGELLGKALTDRQSTAPRLLFVDSDGALGLRRLIPAPVIRLSSKDASIEVDSDSAPVLATCHPGFPQDVASYSMLRPMLPVGFDLLEPFERIAEALAHLPTHDAVERAA